MGTLSENSCSAHFVLFGFPILSGLPQRALLIGLSFPVGSRSDSTGDFRRFGCSDFLSSSEERTKRFADPVREPTLASETSAFPPLRSSASDFRVPVLLPSSSNSARLDCVFAPAGGGLKSKPR